MLTTATEDVSEVQEFKQFTSVPFRWLLTGLNSNLDTSGELFWEETLEKIRLVELINVEYNWSLGLEDDIARAKLTGVAAFLGIRVTFHTSTAKPPVSVKVQINSSWSPLHTVAAPEGDMVTVPYGSMIVTAMLIIVGPSYLVYTRSSSTSQYTHKIWET